MVIYVVEVHDTDSGLWLPMYQPCYTFEEANRKTKVRPASRFKTRVAEYQRVQTWTKGVRD